MNRTPQPGDVITVTTCYGGNETTYKDVRVFRPLPWLQAHEFCIPADGPESQFARIDRVERIDRAPEFNQQAMRYESNYTPSNTGEKFTTRVISMKYVVAINGRPVEEYKEAIKEVRVPASNGGSYKVLVENGIGKTCECKGFQFRGRCRHLQEAEEVK